MRTYPLSEARADLPKLIERALGGEPQRVTQDGTRAVVIVSEAEWAKGPVTGRSLADLFSSHAGPYGYGDVLGKAVTSDGARPLGSDILMEGD